MSAAAVLNLLPMHKMLHRAAWFLSRSAYAVALVLAVAARSMPLGWRFFESKRDVPDRPNRRTGDIRHFPWRDDLELPTERCLSENETQRFLSKQPTAVYSGFLTPKSIQAYSSARQ